VNCDHDKVAVTDESGEEGSETSSSDDDASNREVVRIGISEAKRKGPEAQQFDPLVAYSLHSHKMKMHLAKGADLALHIVVAVLVNQVRYERNAIAITI